MYWFKAVLGAFSLVLFGVTLALGIAAEEPPVSESEPRHYALLVGVSQYPQGVPSLRGPRNDVQLIQRLLLERKFAAKHIQILADGVEGAAGLPTHAAIMNALQRLARQVRSGDFVYLHFSGHGSRQPVTADATEPDGLDEIFLPHDIGRWDGGNHAVRNALVDNEMGKAINRLRERGAFVWAVFDACHSATFARGRGDIDIVPRNVDPGDLGIPETAFAATARSRGAVDASANGFLKSLTALEGSDQGGYVAFYGARPDQIAPDMKLPRNAENSQYYGLLTFTLAKALTEMPEISYRQLNESILQHYSAQFVTSSTPLAEGTHLDAPVFGQTVAPRVRQWPIRVQGEALSLPAGRLHGLDTGAVLAILEKPGDGDDAAKSYLKVRKAGIFQSDVEIFNPNPAKARLVAKDLPPDAYARWIVGQPRLGLRVALPLNRPLDRQKRYSGREQAALGVLKALAKKPAKASTEAAGSASPSTLAIAWVKREQNPDVVLHLDQDQLWLLDSLGGWPPQNGIIPPAITLGDDKGDLQKIVLSHLNTLAKTVNLLRLASEMKAESGEKSLEIRLEHKPGGHGDYQPLAGGNLHTLHPGDKVKITWKNISKKDYQDVTVLLVDGRYGITPISPDYNQLAPGQEAFVEGEINADPPGIERVIAIAVKGEKDAPLSNFSYLAQAALPVKVQAKGVSAMRGSSEYEKRAFEDRLIAAGFGQEKTRGFEATKTGVASMEVLQWRVSQ